MCFRTFSIGQKLQNVKETLDRRKSYTKTHSFEHRTVLSNVFALSVVQKFRCWMFVKTYLVF